MTINSDNVTTTPMTDTGVTPLSPTEPVIQTGSDPRMTDLSQIIRAYNAVTEKLQLSHESLKGQVARLQMELASTNAKLQRSKRLAALGEMAAGIAHEIRNPLGAIQLYAGVLIKDMDDPDRSVSSPDGLKVTALKIASAVRDLNAIVNDVLSFARELSPAPEPMTVQRLFDQAIESCGPMIAAAGVTVTGLDRRSRSGQRLWVHADPALMRQALLNLIRNAVDAMVPSGRCAARDPSRSVLTLDARRQGHQIVMVVGDTGPGIAETDIDRIFNPFFTTRNTGTGLGLAIVHRIIDAHSGTISVHNDGGAVFQLSLPASTVTGPRPDQAHDGRASGVAESGPTRCATGVTTV